MWQPLKPDNKSQQWFRRLEPCLISSYFTIHYFPLLAGTMISLFVSFSSLDLQVIRSTSTVCYSYFHQKLFRGVIAQIRNLAVVVILLYWYQYHLSQTPNRSPTRIGGSHCPLLPTWTYVNTDLTLINGLTLESMWHFPVQIPQKGPFSFNTWYITLASSPKKKIWDIQNSCNLQCQLLHTWWFKKKCGSFNSIIVASHS